MARRARLAASMIFKNEATKSPTCRTRDSEAKNEAACIVHKLLCLVAAYLAIGTQSEFVLLTISNQAPKSTA